MAREDARAWTRLHILPSGCPSCQRLSDGFTSRSRACQGSTVERPKNPERGDPRIRSEATGRSGHPSEREIGSPTVVNAVNR
jgi:hypothetical protein